MTEVATRVSAKLISRLRMNNDTLSPKMNDRRQHEFDMTSPKIVNTATGSIVDVPGLQVGHFTHSQRPTGCSVVLAPQGAVGAVDVRGAAPGTRETDLLAPDRLVQQVDALVLSGGSAFGLDAASGVADGLRAQGRGFAVGDQRVPIVPAAILFDLLNGVMPEIAWLDDSQTLTYLHATVSIHRQRVAVPEVPFHLDALLADCPLSVNCTA